MLFAVLFITFHITYNSRIKQKQPGCPVINHDAAIHSNRGILRGHGKILKKELAERECNDEAFALLLPSLSLSKSQDKLRVCIGTKRGWFN